MIIAMGVFTPFCISAPSPSSRKSVHFVDDSNEKMGGVIATESTFVHNISEHMPPLKRARLSINTSFDKPFVMPNFENLVTVPIKQYNFGPNFYRDLYVEKMEVEEEEEEVDEIIHQLGLLVDEEEVVENDWGIIPLRLEEEFNDEEEEEDMAMDIEEEEEDMAMDIEEEDEEQDEEDEEQDEEDDEEPEPDYNRCRIA